MAIDHTHATTSLAVSELSIAAQTQRFAEGLLSPVEVLDAQIARITAHNPRINAFTSLDLPRARAAALASAQRWRSGQPLGPLDGVSFCAKDNQMVQGLPSRNGSRATSDVLATETSPAVARCMEAGAVFVGLTTMPEFGSDRVTISPLSGTTRNPYDLSRHAGGSSGGAAAAVRAGFACFAIATDAGGSIRIPSAFCGLVGMKPSGGRIPAFPTSAAGALSCVGPITQCVQDAMLVMCSISQRDARDPTVHPDHCASFVHTDPLDLRTLRIAWSLDLGFAPPVQHEVAAALMRAVGLLQAAGAQLASAHPGFDDPTPRFLVMVRTSYQHALRGLDAAQRALLGPVLRGMVEHPPASLAEYLSAQDFVRELSRQSAGFFTQHDLLITPTVGITAFDAEQSIPAAYASNPRGWSPFTGAFNLTQQPAISLPVGTSADGLPIGLQIVGGHGQDHLVLQAAQALQDLLAAD